MSESICISGMATVYNGFADEQTEVTPSGFFFIPVQPLVSTSTKLLPVDIVPRCFSKWKRDKADTEVVLAHFIPVELHVAESMLVQAIFQIF